MKSKATRIFLAVAALLVWGLIIYRMIVGINENNTETPEFAILTDTTVKANIPDTFSLLLNYSDPFLSGKIESKQEIICPKPTKATMVSAPVKSQAISIPFPSIKYCGLITNKQTNKLVAIINISGSQYLAKQGDRIENIVVERMYNDSILINNGQTKKWIRK